MSAGPFTTVAYASFIDATRIYRVRVQPETTGLTVNVGATNVLNQSGKAIADVNELYSAKVSGGKRARGLVLGKIRFKFVDASTVPGGYLQGSTLQVPVLNVALFKAKEGNTGLYQGKAIVVSGVTLEGGR